MNEGNQLKNNFMQALGGISDASEPFDPSAVLESLKSKFSRPENNSSSDAAYLDMEEFLGRDSWTLQKNTASRLHQVLSAKEMLSSKTGKTFEPAHINVPKTFLVQHNWAAAMGAAIDDDEVRIPYDICAFEFMVSGKPVIAITWNQDGDVVFSLLLLCKKQWVSHEKRETIGQLNASSFVQFIWDQIKAACAFLDAEVICETVIRAPHKLNAAREKKGKPLIKDHSVLDLTRRRYAALPEHEPGEGTKKRLHFRRGHWRHFKNHKTWVKWCLVGDPDLGFIQKDYSL